MDVVSGVPRYTFGSVDMLGGLHFIPVMIGLFGLSEVLRNLRAGGTMAAPSVQEKTKTSFVAAAITIWRRKWLVLQSAITGTTIGALPGASFQEDQTTFYVARTADGKVFRVPPQARTFSRVPDPERLLEALRKLEGGASSQVA